MYKVIGKSKKVVSDTTVKYHAQRHSSNNSAATLKDGEITAEYIGVYYSAYKKRTEWLVENFPNSKQQWIYFYRSFLISMINKIMSNSLKDCTNYLLSMQKELEGHQDEFINCPWAQNFEIEWMKKYILT